MPPPPHQRRRRSSDDGEGVPDPWHGGAGRRRVLAYAERLCPATSDSARVSPNGRTGLMGSRGPVPKGHRSRARDEAPLTVVKGKTSAGGAPKLPKGYSAATVTWFKTWASSEQAAEFAATDWQRLLMLAPLVDNYFAAPDRLLMAEIRASESKLGAMIEDRKRLR